MGGKASGTSSRILLSSSGLLEAFSIEISPVAALPGNPKRPTLMKASFQRADLFVFADFVGDLFLTCAVLFTDALSCNVQTINKIGL